MEGKVLKMSPINISLGKKHELTKHCNKVEWVSLKTDGWTIWLLIYRPPLFSPSRGFIHKRPDYLSDMWPHVSPSQLPAWVQHVSAVNPFPLEHAIFIYKHFRMENGCFFSPFKMSLREAVTKGVVYIYASNRTMQKCHSAIDAKPYKIPTTMSEYLLKTIKKTI